MVEKKYVKVFCKLCKNPLTIKDKGVDEDGLEVCTVCRNTISGDKKGIVKETKKYTKKDLLLDLQWIAFYADADNGKNLNMDSVVEVCQNGIKLLIKMEVIA